MAFSGESFYWGIITKTSAVFGALFNKITIKRDAPDGTEQVFSASLHYANKEKMLARLEAVPDADRPYALQLPVISYELADYGYANARKFVSLSRNVRKIPNDKNRFNVNYASVPYDLFYNVYIYAKSIEDGNKILEQILPFFTPDFTVTMMMVPEMNDQRDIPIVLKNCTFEDIGKQDNITERRMLIWTLQFVAHTFFFGPVKPKYIIKDIILNKRLDARIANPEDSDFPPFPADNLEDLAPIVSVTEIFPGRTANNEPTTDPALAIDWHLVDVDDNWRALIHLVNVNSGANSA